MRYRWIVSALLVASPVTAQSIPVNARGAGMAGAFGSVARGPAAGIFNPAMLGLPDNPTFGIHLPALLINYGATPIKLRDLKDWSGEVVPVDVRQEWLDRIAPDGVQRLNAEAQTAALGVSYRNFALNVGAMALGRAYLPRAAAELFLFGNTDETYEAKDLRFENGEGTGIGITYISLAAGMELSSIRRRGYTARLTGGVAVKYVIGNAYGRMWDASGDLTGDPIRTDLQFPMVQVKQDGGWRSSSGFTFDVGTAYENGDWTFGLVVQDLLSTFEWDHGDIRIRDGRALIDEDSLLANFDDLPIDDPAVPADIRQRALEEVDNAKIDPAIRFSTSWQAGPRLTLAGDGVYRFGSRIVQPEARHEIMVGGEYALFDFLPVRAGVRSIERGWGWSAGAGVRIWHFDIDAAYGQRKSNDLGDTSVLALGFSWRER